MFVSSNLIGSTIQITTLPLPVLSTLQASGLVFNTICAALILGEPFTRWSLAGTILVAGGAVLIALYGALPEPSHSLSQLLYLLGRQQFILWMIGTLLVTAVSLVGALLLSRLPSAHSPRTRIWRGMCFGFSSGILAAHSLLVAKSAVELIVRTISDHKNQFDRWQSWVILLSLVFFALSQLYFLHRGLKLCSTSVLYPFVFCIYNIVAILDGLIYFQQTSRLPVLHAGLIAVGTVILLMGVLALSWQVGENGPTTHPDAHTLLTPGFGIVEDTTTESEDSDGDDTDTLVSIDEESHSVITERTALLPPRTSDRSGLATPDVNTYNTLYKNDPRLKITKSRSRLMSMPSRTPSESEVIAQERVEPPRRASTTFAIMRPPVDATASFQTVGRRRRWGSRYRSASLPVPPDVKKTMKKRKKRESRSAHSVHEDVDGVADDEREEVVEEEDAGGGVVGWMKSWFPGNKKAGNDGQGQG